MASQHPKLLLVEGKDEQFTLAFFMDRFVVWGDSKKDWVVEIEPKGGVEDLLKPGYIAAESKVPGRKALGVVLDANDSFEDRWRRAKQELRRVAADFPEEPTPDGLIYTRADGLRLGVWIMPDNQSRGMLETFLGMLIKPEGSALWNFAKSSCEEAGKLEGVYSPVHRDKANIHTYLAWSDPPGKSLQESIRHQVLDTMRPKGQAFARWVITLFELNPRG